VFFGEIWPLAAVCADRVVGGLNYLVLSNQLITPYLRQKMRLKQSLRLEDTYGPTFCWSRLGLDPATSTHKISGGFFRKGVSYETGEESQGICHGRHPCCRWFPRLLND